MNSQQKKYIAERIERIARELRDKLYIELRRIPKPTLEEIKSDIDSGRYELDPDGFAVADCYQKWNDSKDAHKVGTSAYKTRMEIEKEKQRVLDSIFLGDEEDALKTIEAFQNFTI